MGGAAPEPRILVGESDHHEGKIEIVDAAEKIEAFLPLVDGAIAEGLATIERVRVRFYRSKAGRKP